MGRSVSTPCHAEHVSYQTFDDADDEDSNWQFKYAIENVQDALYAAFPSVSEDLQWVGREDRSVASNQFAYFGISEYCGLVAVWVLPRDNDYAEAGWCNLRDRWIAQIGPKFEKTVSGCFGTDLRSMGRFSNGEQIFQPVNGVQQGSMGLGFTSKEGWL